MDYLSSLNNIIKEFSEAGINAKKIGFNKGFKKRQKLIAESVSVLGPLVIEAIKSFSEVHGFSSPNHECGDDDGYHVGSNEIIVSFREYDFPSRGNEGEMEFVKDKLKDIVMSIFPDVDVSADLNGAEDAIVFRLKGELFNDV